VPLSKYCFSIICNSNIEHQESGIANPKSYIFYFPIYTTFAENTLSSPVDTDTPAFSTNLPDFEAFLRPASFHFKSFIHY